MDHEVIITDVTCYGALYCVAGWDSRVGSMIRPEPSTTSSAHEASRFWPQQYVGDGKVFAVGNIVRVSALDDQPESDMPHGLEDRVLIPNSTVQVVDVLTGDALVGAVSDSVRPNLESAFDNQLVRAGNGKCHVVAKANTPSLAAIEVPSADIRLYVDDYNPDKPRLRAEVLHGGVMYDLSVPASAQRTIWKNVGLQECQAEIEASSNVHLRVGLCRAFNGKCYAQVNGFIPI